MAIDVNRANRAAASAGAMNSASVVESACANGPEMMPMTPAMADAITVLASESWFGRQAGEHAGDLVLGRGRVSPTRSASTGTARRARPR